MKLKLIEQDIVKSILDFSKPGKKENIPLIFLIKEAIRLIKAEIPPKIEVILDIPETVKLYVDPQQIKQMFLNLIKNSLDALNNIGQIIIKAEVRDPYVEIIFSDTGKGISKEVLPKIFEPFFSTKEGKTRYGLGLFIVHKIIQEHGGTIEVQSEIGKGTTFNIRLPLSKSF